MAWAFKPFTTAGTAVRGLWGSGGFTAMISHSSLIGAGEKVTVHDFDDDGDGQPNENPTGRIHRLIDPNVA